MLVQIYLAHFNKIKCENAPTPNDKSALPEQFFVFEANGLHIAAM
jgi:hypothetical protein